MEGDELVSRELLVVSRKSLVVNRKLLIVQNLELGT